MIGENPVWSSLIKFGQIWSKIIQNRTAIVILFVSVATFYVNIFRLVRNPIWPILIKFDQVWSNLIKFEPIWTNLDQCYLIGNILISFDPLWTNLDKFNPFWTDLIQNKTAMFILMVNVTTFFSIILWSNIHWGKWLQQQQQPNDKKLEASARLLKLKKTFFLSNLIKTV